MTIWELYLFHKVFQEVLKKTNWGEIEDIFVGLWQHYMYFPTQQTNPNLWGAYLCTFGSHRFTTRRDLLGMGINILEIISGIIFLGLSIIIINNNVFLQK